MLDLYLNPAGCWDFVSIMAVSGNGCKRVKQTLQTPKRKVKFNTEWTETYPCIGKSAQGVDYARCTLCMCDFAVSSGGRTDVRRHVETARHKRMAQTVVAPKGGMGQYVAMPSMVSRRLRPEWPTGWLTTTCQCQPPRSTAGWWHRCFQTADFPKRTTVVSA